MQYSLFGDDDPSWSIPSALPVLEGTVGLDLETSDPDLELRGPGWFPGGRGQILGVALAWRHGDTMGRGYWPLAHASGNIDAPDQFVSWLRAQLSRPNLTWVCHHSSYDVGWVTKEIGPIAGTIHDSWIAAVLLDENRKSFSLDALAREILGERKDERWLRIGAARIGCPVGKVKSRLGDLPAPFVGTYAEVDASHCLRLWEIFRKMLSDQRLGAAYGREQRMVKILIDARNRGVRVDLDQAQLLRDDLRLRERQCLDEIRRTTNLKVDIWSSQSLAILFDELGLEYGRTPDGAPSFTKEFLESCKHPTVDLILTARRVQKARSTFVEGHILAHSINGRLHPSVNQLRDEEGGTRTGRVSYEQPNLQQIPQPKRATDPEVKAFAVRLRQLFLPEDGGRWASMDFKSQEPRVTVHFASMFDPPLPGSQKFVEAYVENPNMDFYRLAMELTGVSREEAKIITLGLTYGMGAGKLCAKLGLPVEPKSFKKGNRTIHYDDAGPEGRAILDKFNSSLPFLSDLAKRCTLRATSRGAITTLGGRTIRFPQNEDHERWEARKALNFLIQGSSADISKQAWIDAVDAGVSPILMVHDELCFSVSSDDDTEILRAKSAMEGALADNLKVKMVADIRVGPTWGSEPS